MSHGAPYILQQVLNTLQLAAFYAPLSIAFALIQSITRRVFLSFGDCAMFASFAAVYICFARLVQGDSDFMAATLSLLFAMAAAGALGWAIAHGIFEPLTKDAALSFMIASLGFSIFLSEAMRISTNSGDIWIPGLFADQSLSLVEGDYPVRITANSAYAVAISGAAIAAAIAVLKFTRFGLAFQACSQNVRLAMLCGINTRNIIAGTFVLGTALSAVSGWMTAITYGGTSFSVGMMLGFKAMFAAVAGGFGSIRGAMAGAVSLAALEVLWSASFGAVYRDVGVFGIIIAILLLKPEGFSGDATRRESET